MAQTDTTNASAAVDDKGKMTLFKDDRAEDIGAIILTVVLVAIILFLAR